MSAPVTAADVAIVGGGPAGSVTALLLARAGFDVAILERRSMPRPKACGDCLSAEAARALDRMGLLGPVLRLGPARLQGWRIVSPGGYAFESRFAEVCAGDPRVATALALPRQRLDAALLDAAAAAGARILSPVHVHAVDRGGELRGRAGDGAPIRVRARLVVGADGLRSVVARALGAPARPARRRKLSLTAHVTGVPGGRDVGEMHVTAGACLGLAPVTETGDVCNVTLVLDADRVDRDATTGAEALFRQGLARFPQLGARLNAMRIDGPLLASGPFDFPVNTTVADGCALVGDAAGYFDPFTGQGIYHAIACAEMLAEEAAAALHALDVSARRLARYAQRRRTLLRGTRALQRIIDEALARPRVADRVIRRLHARSDVAAALLAVTGDLRPPRSLVAPSLLLRFLTPTLAESGS